MIYIDFMAGAHGFFLEFVCNKFLAGIRCPRTPFSASGASHNIIYFEPCVFSASHYFENPVCQQYLLRDADIVSIRQQPDDYLSYVQIMFLRSGNQNIDLDLLEHDTFNKLHKSIWKDSLHYLATAYFQDTRVQDYQAIKDPSWPSVSSVAEFESLPAAIREECETVHGLIPLRLDAEFPDCPRYILREFFKPKFATNQNIFFEQQQKEMVYDESNRVYNFEYRDFYHTDRFVAAIQSLGEHLNMPLKNLDELLALHQEFLSKQPYKYSKQTCDDIVERIHQCQLFDLPKLTLFEESYINARLEMLYNKPAPFREWWNHSKHFIEYWIEGENSRTVT